MVTTPDRPVDTVLLDVDGTLVDSTHLHALAWQRTFADADLYPEWWRIHRAIGIGGDRLVGELCGEQVEAERGDALRERWADEYRRLLSGVYPIPGAVELVRSLSDKGYRVAVASSGAPEFTDFALDLLGLRHGDFAAVVTSADADESKPAANLLQVALDRAGGHTGILVGDSVWDVVAANRLPADCVGVRTGGFAESELADAGAVLVVDDVDALVARDWRP
ncbi:HAD family hydrolase [Gordonia sinesedis]